MNDKELFAQALGFAAQKHLKQKRRDGRPYIYHPIEVADLVQFAGYGLRFQIVALLHDVLEDTDATDADIAVYGQDIFEAVKLLTRIDGMDEKDYVDGILRNHMAAVVKSCDIINNMYDTAHCNNKEWVKRYVTKAETYDYGKFSLAVDNAITTARVLSEEKCEYRIMPSIDPNEMKLYCWMGKEEK